MAGRTTFVGLWTLWRNPLVHADSSAPPTRVDVFDLETGQVNRIFSGDLGLYVGMTVSPDGRWVLLSIGESDTSGIMLVEGFR